MENRGKICDYDHLVRAINICSEIQNTGIGTIFIDFSGHVNMTYIRIHTPVWIQGVDAGYKFELHHDMDDEDGYNFKRNMDVVDNLLEILHSGKLSEDKEKETIHNKEKVKRRQEYEKLKKEFEAELISD